MSGTSERGELIARLYAAYNGRDLDALSALVREDVDWPDGDGRLHGRMAVRRFWMRQWSRVRTCDEVVGVEDLDAQRTAVRISQTVRELGGAVISRGSFEHIYRFQDGLVARMDLRELATTGAIT